MHRWDSSGRLVLGLEIVPAFATYRGLYEFSQYSFQAVYAVSNRSEEYLKCTILQYNVAFCILSIRSQKERHTIVRLGINSVDGFSFLLTRVVFEAEHERHAMAQSAGLEERVE
jgi:hypothetical protein